MPATPTTRLLPLAAVVGLLATAACGPITIDASVAGALTSPRPASSKKPGPAGASPDKGTAEPSPQGEPSAGPSAMPTEVAVASPTPVGLVASASPMPATPAASASDGLNPAIQAFTASPSAVASAGQPITFQVVASDPGGKPLSYNWSATGGLLSSNTGQLVTWKPPAKPGTYTVQVLVSNALGGAATQSRNLTVLADGSVDVSTTATPGPAPSATVTAAPTATPTATPTPAPTATPTPAPEVAATAEEIAAARAFPFKRVGDVWTYTFSIKAGTFNLPGTRRIEVTAVGPTSATVKVREVVDLSKIPLGAQAGPRVYEKTLELATTMPDPYLPIASLMFEADLVGGEATYKKTSVVVADKSLPAVTQTYKATTEGNAVDIKNWRLARIGLARATVVATKLPPGVLPKEFASFSSFGFNQTLILATAPAE